MRAFINVCRVQKLSDTKILKQLKTKYPVEYQETKKHWEYKKKDAAKKGIMDDDFKDFLPVLYNLGFKPGSNYQIDREHPDQTYSVGNIRWATPSQNNSNKLNAAHNQALPNVNTLGMYYTVGDEYVVFNYWYDVLIFHYPNINPLQPDRKILKSIRDSLLPVLALDKILRLIEYSIENWTGQKSDYDPPFENCNYRYGSHLPGEPTLTYFIRYFEAVNAYFGARLNAYKGNWESAKERQLRIEKLKIQMQQDYERRQKLEALKVLAFQKLEEDSYLLRISLAIDINLVPTNNIPIQGLLAELHEKYALTEPEYQAFKTLYLEDFTESKKMYLTSSLNNYLSLLSNPDID